MSRPRILLADDHAILLEAFRKLLDSSYDVVGAVTDGRALVEAATRLRPDVVVADIAMPQLNGLEALEKLKGLAPGVKLLFLTMNEDRDVAEEAIRRGANGYVLKKSASAELFEAIRQILRGRTYITSLISQEPTAIFVAEAKSRERGRELSLRQREVLQLLAEGRSMKEAAAALKLTPRTIAFHKYSMMELLGFKTGAELIQYAVRQGLVSPKGGNPSNPPSASQSV